ncbi:hypothetical protein K2173_006972 [Erythroxylum novogranatense]|uniref:CCHC-type domain-containing protein n=1 Tax=Erythroxylum novogranatense TaxID=1862640 RepID=A0AAV8SZG6_9ROSI|nr:hypothetical protein K2173_006972 [Erythroxylum novogranatense]
MDSTKHFKVARGDSTFSANDGHTAKKVRIRDRNENPPTTHQSISYRAVATGQSLPGEEDDLVWPKEPPTEVEEGDITRFKETFGNAIELSETFKTRLETSWSRVVVVDLGGEMIKVAYEGLPQICYTCGRVGHGDDTCLTREHGRPAIHTDVGECTTHDLGDQRNTAAKESDDNEIPKANHGKFGEIDRRATDSPMTLERGELSPLGRRELGRPLPKHSHLLKKPSVVSKAKALAHAALSAHPIPNAQGRSDLAAIDGMECEHLAKEVEEILGSSSLTQSPNFSPHQPKPPDPIPDTGGDKEEVMVPDTPQDTQSMDSVMDTAGELSSICR